MRSKRILSFVALVIVTVICFGMLSACASNDIGGYKGFVKVNGTKLYDEEGNEFLIKSMGMGNDVWANPSDDSSIRGVHHTAESYVELAEWGFNSVRFYLNYGLFEDDENPYVYKEVAWKWLDDNVQWAKKAGIRIVFNMHVPQGGFQSLGEGTALWTEEENMNRLVALWKAIAERYADEPTVLGYALINEPMVATDDVTKACDILRDAYQRITDEIRTVDTNHIIFVERLYSVKDTNTDTEIWGVTNDTYRYTILNDDNVVYEYHNYEPFEYTHQGAGWTYTENYDYSYPTVDTVVATNPKFRKATKEGVAKNDVEGWQYVESELMTYDDEYYNVLGIGFQAKGVGDNGVAYIDNLVLKEYDENGEFIRDIYTANFEDSLWSKLEMWSANESGEGGLALNEGYDSRYAYRISGTKYNAYASYSTFKPTMGHKYQATGYIRVENVDANAAVAACAEFFKAESVSEMNKEAMRYSVADEASHSEELGVPIYCGEVGAIYSCFMRRGGEIWAEDMLSLYLEYGIGFNYHCYSGGTFGDPGFGVYQTYGLPNDDTRNEKLCNVFKKLLVEDKE